MNKEKESYCETKTVPVLRYDRDSGPVISPNYCVGFFICEYIVLIHEIYVKLCLKLSNL